ncbi:IS1182 family transposase [Pendulispora albinea]|uniref:IS1182 family transposase n=1 Tax=Pendulispora albinea TaxID=2741071 RepID=A0ABZ2LX30_9BACT
MIRWSPSVSMSKREKFLIGRMTRTGKLFAFLRTHRHELFDDAFQSELEGMYRESGEGKQPVAPALLAMVILLQAYTGASDAQAVELSIVDARWQMVLGVLGEDDPPFSQGALPAFRQRLMAHDMDRRLLERTIELARRTAAFDWKKLPKQLRIAIDSRPLEGAGRVEDTFNLLAHAARKVLACAARLVDMTPEEIARHAGAPLLLDTSIKAGLDIEWSDPAKKAAAIGTLVKQLDGLERWIARELGEEAGEPPLAEPLATLRQLREQDLEPEPPDNKPRIRKGTAEDRRVSVEDKDMRHGHKSKAKRFNGYKGHIACDLDTNLIVACAITPANRPEVEALPSLQADIARIPQRNTIAQLSIDRGYINSPMASEVFARGGEVLCKPWVSRNGTLFPKSAFTINMRSHTITCPTGQTKSFTPGDFVEFDAEACGRCPLRAKCTSAAPGRGRKVAIARDEPLQHRLRKLMASSKGRERLRERVKVEHALAHLSRKQGCRARYLGVRKNVFDLRRHAAVVNLEAIHRTESAMAA